MDRDGEPKHLKHQGLLNDLLDQNQLLQQEIGMLRAQVAAAPSAPQVVVPPMPPPGNPPADRSPPLISMGGESPRKIPVGKKRGG